MSDEEVIIKKPNVLGDERHIHPSFGMLAFNRISGGSPYLYGSSIKHRDKIQHSGYYVISPDKVKFEVGEIEVEKDDLYNDTYSMDGYYYVSPNHSTKYMTERYLNRVLKLNRGCVLYSFDKSKIIQWLRNIKESETRKAQCLLDSLLNSQIMEVSYKYERLGT